jgi:phosphatidylinositol-3-phosphatase
MKGLSGRTAARLALGAVACGWPLLVPATAGATTTAGLEGVPRVQHVVTLVLENEDFASTWSASSPAKYLNSLVKRGAFVPNYYATGHVSLDNYIAMTSGLAGPQVGPTYTDCLGLNLFTCVQDVSAAASLSGSVADQIEQAGLTWKQFSDGTSAPCVHADYSTNAGSDNYQGNGGTPTSNGAGPNYADRHVPFLYYSNIVGDSTRCDAHLRPFTELHADLVHDTLPAYSFITPDTCNDGHDSPCGDKSGRPGGLTTADLFLSTNLPSLLAYLQAHDGVLFITTDEGATNNIKGCCHGGPGGQAGFGGQIGLLALGPVVAAGTTSSASYDHASLLRTEEDLLGISTYLNNAASSTPMSDIWSQVAGATTQLGSAGTVPATPTRPALTALPNTAAGASGGAAAAVLALVALAAIRRRR